MIFPFLKTKRKEEAFRTMSGVEDGNDDVIMVKKKRDQSRIFSNHSLLPVSKGEAQGQSSKEAP